MDRERLTRLLEEPGRVAREDLSDLKALAERYPWFSGAQLLRVAGEQAAGDVLFDETLQSATAHLPSRAVLFDLVEKKGLQVPIPPRSEPRILRLPIPEPTPVVVRIELPDPEPVPDTANRNAPALPDRIEREESRPVSDVIEDPLERQIQEAALASAYDLTWKEEAREAVVQKPLRPKPDEEITSPSAPTIPDDAQPKVVTLSPEPQRISVGPSSRLRFTEWLGTAEPVTSSEPPALPGQATPLDAQDWLRGTPVATTIAVSEGQPNLTDTHELINRFIQQQTPDPVRKTEFFTPQQAARRSLDDTAGLVTETLARVYEKQGNLPKAIEAYRKLALKYPHKSDYFAALQKSLEEQLNK